MTMRVHYLQHVAFEGLGSIEPWLQSAGHSITSTRLFLGESLPPTDAFDCLIVMGGPMGANDEAKLGWMESEKHLIRASIDARKHVLGICLGAQLIASVLGASVYPNREREIGWFPIRQSPEAAENPLGMLLPRQADVFHWHGDTFDLPRDAVRLASSDGCLNQSFAYGPRVLAFQFHLEMTSPGATRLIEECQNELTNARYIQTPAQMMADLERFDRINGLMASVLEEWLGHDT